MCTGMRSVHVTRRNTSVFMDVCEEYTRLWAEEEDIDVDALSEWIKSTADAIKRRIRRLKLSVNTKLVHFQ